MKILLFILAREETTWDIKKIEGQNTRELASEIGKGHLAFKCILTVLGNIESYSSMVNLMVFLAVS